MKLFHTVAAALGYFVFLLMLAGIVGFGHFRLYYGDSPPKCEVPPVAGNQGGAS